MLRNIYLTLAFGAMLGCLSLATPAGARSSQPIADWAKVEQEPGDGADYVNCPSFLKASGTFSQGCLVGVLTTANPSRAVNVLGWYDRNGIPRAYPDPRIQALPRLYNLTPPVPVIDLGLAAGLEPGDELNVICSGQPTVATFYRFQKSTQRIEAFVPNGFGSRMIVRWEKDGTPVGRNSCVFP